MVSTVEPQSLYLFLASYVAMRCRHAKSSSLSPGFLAWGLMAGFLGLFTGAYIFIPDFSAFSIGSCFA